MRNLYEILIERARRFPEAVALGGQSGLTWKSLTSLQMKAAVDALAVELAEREGVREGDRVVLWLPNAPRTPIYLFALWKLGAIVVPFDREMNPEAAAAIIASTEPARVIVGFGERPAWAAGAPVVDWWEPGSLGKGEAGRRGGGEAGEGGGEAGRRGSDPHPHPHPHPLPGGERG
jgi:acyl-CoA synthetase (AMP-forming)/AMP-acid ligase II